MAVETDVIVTAPAWEAIEDLDALAATVVAQCVRTSKARLAKSCEICVNFCDDAAIRALNAQWRGKDQPTNVLSFPTPGALSKKPLLGDVAIAFETVRREAIEQEKPFLDHVRHMIIHGFLHLIGYDHEASDEAEEMEALERRIAAALGIGDPYEGSVPEAQTAGASQGE
jgi:probable rRNA maturation factor